MFKAIFYLLLLSFIFSFCSSVSAQEKYALLVGVNEYSSQLIPGLMGCVNDVENMKTILITKYGFKESNIKILTNKNATKVNIQNAFKEWLIDKPKPGDIVVFHFSGHGSQVPDKNGDESDGFDETLCPYDTKMSSRVNDITDDELGSWIKSIKTDNILIILDSCHSGTGTRALSKADDNLAKPRYIDYKTRGFEEDKKDTVSSQETVNVDNKPSNSTDDEDMNHTLISACASMELASDWYFDGYYSGALTNSLIANLKKATPEMTYKDLMDNVIPDVKARFTQSPQLEGNVHRKILMLSNEPKILPKPFILIISVSNKNVKLGSGKSYGVTVNSIYDVYSPDEVNFTGTPIGKVKIISVLENQAEGIIMEGNEIEPYCRAIESFHYAGGQELFIRFDSATSESAIEPIKSALKNISYIKWVKREDFADRILKVGKKIDGYSATLITPNASEESEVYGKSLNDIANGIKPLLEKVYIVKRLALLDNPAPEFNISIYTDKLDPTYIPGDLLTLKFKSNKDCYLTLIDIGTSGNITILYPNEHHKDNKIIANKEYSISEDFNIEVAPPFGMEMVKAIATIEPLNPFNINASSEINNATDFVSKMSNQLAKALGSKDLDNIPTKGWASSFVIITIKEKR